MALFCFFEAPLLFFTFFLFMRHLRLRHFLLLLLTLLSAQAGWSQGTTTSSMTGVITDKTGAELPGATIIAVHTPTNTQYVGPTNSDGRFNIQNMRVGGPYTVRVTFVGYQEAVREGIFLTLGQSQRLDINLSETTTQLNDVVVTGSDPRSVLNAERSGAVTNISREEIQRLPSITRSLNDFTRLTPQASSRNAGAVGGGNYRQNNITIDGADFNNNFGIGGNLPANGNPISLDAIEEITVNITPFDVRQSNFVGSAVNAVTRSGSNEFSGSVYTFWRNQNQQGDKVGTERFTKQKLDDNIYGFRVGGPIIKDKLFFFLNAERQKTTSPGQNNVASTPDQPFGAGNTPANVVRPRASFLDSVSNFLQEKYNYETGGYQGYGFESDRTNILGRLDWNISNNHHVTVRYSQVESKSPSFVSTSRSPLAAFPNTRTSNFALPFRNANYYTEANFYSLAAEWNGTFAGKIYNTLRGTYTNQNDPRSSDSSPFPFVDILGPDGNPITSFGYEPFTLGNLRDVKSYSIVDFANVVLGKHSVTGGFQFDLQTTKNGFQRFGTGYYTYDSWATFVRASSNDPVVAAAARPTSYAVTYPLTEGYQQAFPQFKFAQTSLYAQDEISVTDRLRVTAGLRAEVNSYLKIDEIQTLQPVAALTFAGDRKIDTGVLPSTKVLWSPRLGFNWDVKGDRTLQLRGGSGIFSGRVPTVWIVAQSGDAGLLQVTRTYSTAAEINGLPGGYRGFSPDPAFYRPETVPTAGTVIPSTVSATDPNFRNPQTWKSSLAVDARLPGGIVGSLEGIYNRDLITAFGKNYNLVDPQQYNIVGNPDNRPFYPASNAQKFINKINNDGTSTPTATGAFNPVVLSNGYKGYYWSATAKLEKRFANGLSALVAYTQSQAKNQFDGGGDQLLNTWSNTQIVNNNNNPELSYANYVVPSRLIASLTYRKEYFGHLGTQISVFYEGSTQGRYSYVYGGDLNRDGQSTNDLIYVPNNPSEITFTPFTYNGVAYTAQQQSDIFFRYIEQDPYLRTRRGKYAERNGAKFPWRNQFDVRLAQDIFGNLNEKRNTLQFTLDIFNAGNLLNSEWGIFQTVNNTSILLPTNTASLSPDGVFKPTFRLATDRNQPITSTYRPTTTLTSTYYMQFGLRYIFN